MVKDRANITISIKKKVRYMPSNGAIANVVHCDLGLYFQCHKISANHIIFNIWKMVRASENAQVHLLQMLTLTIKCHQCKYCTS